MHTEKISSVRPFFRYYREGPFRNVVEVSGCHFLKFCRIGWSSGNNLQMYQTGARFFKVCHLKTLSIGKIAWRRRRIRMEHWWNDTDMKTEVLEEKPVPVPLLSPQIPNKPAWDPTWACAVRRRRLTAWPIAWLIGVQFESRSDCGHRSRMFIGCSVSLRTMTLTPRSTVLPEKLKRPQLVKKYQAFYGTWRFITAFTSIHHLSQINPVPCLPILLLEDKF